MIGWSIVDGNHNVLQGCAIESGGTGVSISATQKGASDRCMIAFCRFENNSVAGVKVDPSTVGSVDLLLNDMVSTGGGYQGVEAGQDTATLLRTTHRDRPWIFERTAAITTANTPAVLVRDSYSNSGAPVTVQIDCARWSGWFLQGTRAGETIWHINGNGAMKPGAYSTSSRPSASAAGAGGMIYDLTLRKPIWSDGSTWRDASGAAV
jgi:hypothetical protein